MLDETFLICTHNIDYVVDNGSKFMMYVNERSSSDKPEDWRLIALSKALLYSAKAVAFSQKWSTSLTAKG